MTPPYSAPVRLHQIGARLERRLEPNDKERAAIARELDLASLRSLVAKTVTEPTAGGWRLSGRIEADGAQICGISLEPLPFRIDEPFSVAFAEAGDAPADDQILVEMDDESPDLIDDGQVDLGVYLVEQLALRLDPFPRKEGAVFEQPEEPTEISPFAVLKRLDPGKA